MMNIKRFEKRLKGKSSRLAFEITLRSNMRVFPSLGFVIPRLKDNFGWRNAFILPTFRHLIFGHSIFRFQSPIEIIFTNNSLNIYFDLNKPYELEDYIALYLNSFPELFFSFTSSHNTQYYGVYINTSIDIIANLTKEPNDLQSHSVDLDLDFAILTNSIGLAAQPLWLDDTPEWAVRGWETLATELTKRAPYWKTLVRWYEDRLHGDDWAAAQGRPAIPELEIARASLPDSYWKRGGKAVNDAIAKLEDYYWKSVPIDDPVLRELVGPMPWRIESIKVVEATPELLVEVPAPPALPPIEAIPEQAPTAFQFTDAPDRPIDLAIPTPDEAMLDTPGRREDYAELRRKLLDLNSESDNQLGRLKVPITAFLVLGEDLSRIRTKLFLSRFNTLRGPWASHLAVAKEDELKDASAARPLMRDPDLRRLDPIVAEKLGDVVGDGNIFIFDDPELAKLDARRAGAQELASAKAENAAIESLLRAAVAEPELATPEARAVIEEQMDIISQAEDTLPDRQNAELARDTERNFVSALLRKAYRAVKAEGRNVRKVAKEGAYREIGKITLDKFLEYGMQIGPSAMKLVTDFSSDLIHYVQLAFRNPEIQHIIQWIARLGGV